MVETRGQTQSRAEDSEAADGDFSPDVNSQVQTNIEMPEASEQSVRLTGDATWDRLCCLPFFQMASMAEKREMYQNEVRLEEERRREERAFELKRLELINQAETSSRSSSVTAPPPRLKVKLPDWDSGSTIDSYLDVCESLLEGAEIPDSQWVGHIVPKLSSEARTVYKALDRGERNDYGVLKRALLTHYAVSPAVYRRNFFEFEKSERQGYRQFLRRIEDQLKMWRYCVTSSGEQLDWEQLLMIYRLEQELTDEVRVYMKTQRPKDANEFVTLADDFVQSLKISRRERNGSKQSGPERSFKDKRPWKSSGNRNDSKGMNSVEPKPDSAAKVKRDESSGSHTFCTYCKRSGHPRENCFRNPDSSSYRPRSSDLNVGAAPFKPESASHPKRGEGASNVCTAPLSECTSDVHPAFQQYAGRAMIGSPEVTPITYLRDTGATICLLDKNAAPPLSCAPRGEVTVTGYDGVRTTYPTAKVKVQIPGRYDGPMTVALVNGQPTAGVSLLVGNDLAAIAPALNMPCCVVTRNQSRRPALETTDHLSLESLFQTNSPALPVANEESADRLSEVSEVTETSDHDTGPSSGEAADPPQPWTLTPNEVKALQEADPTLTPLWGLAGREEDDCPYYAHSVNGILMYRSKSRKDSRLAEWEDVSQIVVPRKLRPDLLRWAHDDLTAGHLSEKKSLERLRKHFTWPGIRRDLQLHCRGCGSCQRLGKGAQSNIEPLKPLPVVGRPFALAAADVVGPLPKTQKGNRYIITILDHCTRYLEAFPVPVADTANVKASLTEVFTRHGMCRQLLTDRGSVFIGEPFQEFLRELNLQHLLTPAYRPESNGTLERAHATMKSMIEACLENEPEKEWDELLPWILFAYRSAKHGSTGFSPFALLFGRDPITPLGLISLAWLGELLEPKEIPAAEYVATLRARLSAAWDEAAKNDAEEKKNHAESHDRRRRAKRRSYARGDMVLIHLPQRGKPLVGEWQGPYPVQERLGDQTYLISTPDKRLKRRQLHANALRPWQQRPAESFICAATSSLLAEGQTLGDLMSDPGPPTELEVRQNPVDVGECVPKGSFPSTDHLGAEQRESIQRLFDKHKCLFSGNLGRMRGVLHDVDVGSNAPIKQHYYRLSPEKVRVMKNEVEQMLELGVIQPSHSEWSSPLILVKQGSKFRPCTDYRALNAITKGESYPLPRLDDLIDQVGNSPFISTLDLSKGYWQIPLTDRAREVSAFSTPFGHYEYKTMPFGMKSAPLTFQKAMNSILHGLSEFAIAYLDDISIRSNTWDEHLCHLDEVFARLADRGLTLNAAKCMIGGATVKYLGYQVGGGRVAPLSAKIEAVAKIPLPSTKKQLRSFLGVLSFYRRFIPYFADTAAPLTDLLKGKRPADITLTWSNAASQAFEQLKAALICRPLLKAPDFEELFEIYTDASNIGIAAVLTQEEDGVPKPVIYFSRKLLPQETRYATIEKELLAIIAALDAFAPYVGYGPVVVHSDHQPLRWLRRCTTANQRLLRWALKLGEYDLEVRHIKGCENRLADMLSRHFEEVS